MRDLLVGKTDLSNGTAGVAGGEDGDGVAITAGAFGAAGTMTDGAEEEGAAEDVAGLGEAGEKTVALDHDLVVFH